MAEGERLTEVSFKNLKTLRDVTLPLAPFTVIIGRNGVGKTTVLEGIDAVVGAVLKAPHIEGLLGARRSFADVASRQGANAVSLHYRNRGNSAGIVAFRADQRNVFDETFGEVDGWKVKVVPNSSLLSGPSTILRLDARLLATPSTASTGDPRLGPSGEGLATVLNHYIGRRRDPIFGRILESLKQVVPEVEDLETEPTEVVRHVEEVIRIDNDALTRQREERLPGHKLFLHMRGVGRIAADEASEGTLLVLGLLTALYSSGASIILVDDLDRALHPEAQLHLVKAVRRIVVAKGVQVIATAHSPVVLMEMRDDEIIHLELDETGATRVMARVGDSPGVMTGSEILDRYFGITRVALSQDIQRYALLAGDPHRTEADEAELTTLKGRMKTAGVDLDLEPVARAAS